MKVVAIIVNGVVDTHIPSHNENYDTLCGLDGGQPGVLWQVDFAGQEPTKAEINKVTCKECYGIWMQCKKFRKQDFITGEENGQ